MARPGKRKSWRATFSLKGIFRSLTRGGRPAAMVLLVLALIWQETDPGGFLEVGRAKVFDLYQQIKPRERPVPAERPVTIIDIDENSLTELGQWPWSRNIVAKMLVNLFQAGAATVGFDVVFAEEDRLSPSVLARSMEAVDPVLAQRLAKLPSSDGALAEVIGQVPVVLGMTVVEENLRVLAEDLPQTSLGVKNGDPAPFVEHYPALLRNIAEIDRVAAGRGIFNVSPEKDGIVRRIPAMVMVADKHYPTLAVEILRVATGAKSILVRMENPNEGILGIKDIVLGRTPVETDAKGRIYVYAGKSDKASYLSAKDVLSGSFDPALVAGKLIIVGSSAAGLRDIRATAVDSALPGVDIHAQIIETVLSGQQLQIPADAHFYETLATVTTAILMIILVPMIGARWTLVAFLVATGSLIGGSWYFFANERLLYDPVFATLVAMIHFMQLTYYGYASEEAQRRQVRTAFGRYLSPALVEKLAKDPGHLKLGGEMRDMTLLFCDVRGFTTISELFDAEGLTRLINRFLTPMTDVILERFGTIDKYMGDCIMAFWNAPLDDDDHARHSCESALVMMERLGPLNDSIEAEAKAENRRHVPIKIGIGLNSGPVCVGNMGSTQRFDYSVLGDTVNLASRLEGQSKPYGVYIVIGDETRKRAPDYASLELDLLKVKGKTEAVRIWTLLGRPEMAREDWFKQLEAAHQAMLAAYRGQDWAEARALLAKCDSLRNGLHIEGFYELMEERIAEFEQNPPGEGWDGVFTATSK